MLKIPHPHFNKMDELSLQKVPFFFMVDFLGENAVVYTESELNSLIFKTIQTHLFNKKKKRIFN